MLETGEWVLVILTAAVVTAVVVTVGYLLGQAWLMSSAWLLGLAVAGLVMYLVRRSDES